MFLSRAICTLDSGGTTERIAWGRTICDRVRLKVNPRAREASACPTGTVLIPERTTSQTNAAV